MFGDIELGKGSGTRMPQYDIESSGRVYAARLVGMVGKRTYLVMEDDFGRRFYAASADNSTIANVFEMSASEDRHYALLSDARWDDARRQRMELRMLLGNPGGERVDEARLGDCVFFLERFMLQDFAQSAYINGLTAAERGYAYELAWNALPYADVSSKLGGFGSMAIELDDSDLSGVLAMGLEEFSHAAEEALSGFEEDEWRYLLIRQPEIRRN